MSGALPPDGDSRAKKPPPMSRNGGPRSRRSRPIHRLGPYMLEFLGGKLPPWDRGVLDAHYINCGTTETIQEHLNRARRRRYGPLALLSGWRRKYLAGLIWSLETELGRRSRY